MRERLMAAALIAALSATPSVAQDKPAGPAAQEKAPAPAMQPSGGQVPLRVTVVISRLQGDKKIASLPYSFGTLAGERTNLRMGSDVPIISRAPTLEDRRRRLTARVSATALSAPTSTVSPPRDQPEPTG